MWRVRLTVQVHTGARYDGWIGEGEDPGDLVGREQATGFATVKEAVEALGKANLHGVIEAEIQQEEQVQENPIQDDLRATIVEIQRILDCKQLNPDADWKEIDTFVARLRRRAEILRQELVRPF